MGFLRLDYLIYYNMSNLPKAGNSVVTTKTTKDEYIAASRFGGME